MKIDNRYTSEFLKELCMLPLERKVGITLARICEFHQHYDGNVYVSFSGGKDSSVLLHLVRGMYPDVPAVFVDTGMEYPGVREFAISTPGVTVLKPRKSFATVISQYGYPVGGKEVANIVYNVRRSVELHGVMSPCYQRRFDECANGANNYNRFRFSAYKKARRLLYAPFKISHKCCNVMKKSPCVSYERQTGRCPIIATMAEESALRRNSWIRHGCNNFNSNRPKSNPMSFWTENDVLEYIVAKGIPIASEYGQIVRGEDGRLRTTGLKRTGCMFCLFGIEHEDTPNRIQRLAETNPKIYRHLIEKMEYGMVMDWLGVPYLPIENKGHEK